MKKPAAQTIVLGLVLGLGAAITSCSLVLLGDKDYVDLDTTGSSSGETTTGETATGTGGAAMTTSSSSAGGMTTGQGGSTGTCGSSQGGCGGAPSTTASSTSTASSTASASASASASSSTGSGGPTPCGAGGSLSDSFTGGTLDSNKWGAYADAKGSKVTQTNNQIAIFSTGDAGAFAGVYSKDRFPLDGCSVSLKLVDSPKIAGLTAFFLLSSLMGDPYQVDFAQSGNYLNMEVKLMSGTKASKQITFVKGKHVYWRFRESSAGGGTVHWETSDTGAVWEEHFTYPTANLGFPVNQMLANFGVTANGAPSTTVHVDSFNLIP
ncbi:MAG: hypothetical protein ABI134_12235 [Byssovorax sp.]